MPDVLHLTPEDVDTIEKRGKYNVSIVGCGPLGLSYAIRFSEAGFRVVCADADQSLVKRLAKGKATFSERGLESKLRSYVRSGALDATSNIKGAVAKSDVIILATTLIIDSKKNSNFSEVESLCKQIGSVIQRGKIVIYGGMTSFGFIEEVVKETLENSSGLKAGADFGLAYTQGQTDEQEQPLEIVGSREWIVAANDKASLDATSLFIATITKNAVKQMMNIKVAELATLFEFARRDMTVALTNELAVLCEKAGVDYFDTLKFMNPRFRASDYAPTIAEGREKTEAYLLLENAENLGERLRLPDLARQINESMVKHVVNLTQEALRSCGKTLRRSRIAVLGATEPGTSGESFVRMLEMKGARINLYGRRAGKSEDTEAERVPKRTLNEAVENSDCVIILTADDQFRRLNLKNLRSLMKTQAAIVDLVGLFEPGIVESEGFIYRGLGRGAEKK